MDANEYDKSDIAKRIMMQSEANVGEIVWMIECMVRLLFSMSETKRFSSEILFA